MERIRRRGYKRNGLAPEVISALVRPRYMSIYKYIQERHCCQLSNAFADSAFNLQCSRCAIGTNVAMKVCKHVHVLLCTCTACYIC